MGWFRHEGPFLSYHIYVGMMMNQKIELCSSHDSIFEYTMDSGRWGRKRRKQNITINIFTYIVIEATHSIP